MAKALNQVNLTFTADTTKAKQAIQDLQASLTNLALGSNASSKFALTEEINEASRAAAELKVHLQNATNVNTGNLDFAKLDQSLRKSGVSLQQYSEKLLKLGPEGQQAFMQLTRAVAQSEVPLRRNNVALQQFATTLKNTARWQISSSILHGFIGAIQSAYHYAQDLNESLNNIRIVTGQSMDKMDRFAEKANKAAKSLSTTTTSYTNAALIYYQQGLSDQEVEERTNATIKLANVSRQSAEEVSSQMTAIWNNFDNGSKSLEYYGDVITALGAKTAASSEEIATGLEKFAAVAETVGLSYEYATAALATVVAQTRQSADTVGTAFRTIFSRLEGLKLGKTLEDGVDLNKYSAALKTIGVNILDTTGNLKDMNTILDETAAHWDTLSQAQKVAFAETVGGVRQYTNLIALLDNWDKMQTNVQTASTAEGTLQEQADIYAESWEAASKRTKAAAESLYTTILDDDAFIALTDGLAKAIEFVEKFVNALGGVKGTLLVIASLATQAFSKQIAQNLENGAYQLKMLFGGQKAMQNAKQETLQNAINQVKTNNFSYMGESQKEATIAGMTQQLTLQQQLSEKAASLNEQELQVNQTLLDRVGILAKLAEEAGKQKDIAAKEVKQAERDLARSIYAGAENKGASREDIKKLREEEERAAADWNKSHPNDQKNVGDVGTIESARRRAQIDAANATRQQEINQRRQTLSTETQTLKGSAAGIEKINVALNIEDSDAKAKLNKIKAEIQEALSGENEFVINDTDAKAKLEALKRQLDEINLDDPQAEEKMAQIAVEAQAEFEAAQSRSTENLKNNNFDTTGIENLIEKYHQGAISAEEFKQKLAALSSGAKSAGDSLQQSGSKTRSWAQTLTQVSSAIMGLVAVVNAAKSAMDTFNNPDASGWDQFTAVIGVAIPLISVLTTVLYAVQPAGAAAGAGMTAAMGVVGLVIVAIVALTAAIVILINSMDSLAKQQQRAQKAAKELAEAEKEAQKNAEKLKETINKYDSAIEKLNECTKGTKEWNEALKEVNASALEVINNLADDLDAETYSKLLDIYRETGRLDTDILSKAQSNADRKVLESTLASAMAQKQVADLNLQINIESLSSQMGKAIYSNLSDEEKKQTSKEQVTKNVDQIISQHYEELASAIGVEEFKEKFNQFGEQFGITLDQIGGMETVIPNWKTQINSMSSTAMAAAKKFGLIAGVVADEVLPEGTPTEAKNYALSQVEQVREKTYKTWYSAMNSDGGYLTADGGGSTDNGLFITNLQWVDAPTFLLNGELVEGGINAGSNADNPIYQAVLHQYQKMGRNYQASYGNPVQGTDNKNRAFEFMYQDDAGNWKTTDPISAEAIATEFAAYEALQSLPEQANEAIDYFNTLTDADRTVASLIGKHYQPDTGTVDFSALFSEQKQNDLNKLNTTSFEALAKSMGFEPESFNNMLKYFGITDFEKAQNDFVTEASNAIDGINTAGLNAVAKIIQKTDEFDQVYNNSNFTIKEKETLGKQIHSAFEIGGEQAALDIVNFYKNIDPNERAAALKVLSSQIDWSNMSVDLLADMLTEAGISADAATLGLDKVIAALQKIGALSFDSLSESYGKLKKVLDGLNIGDTISKDDYKLLSTEGKKYFQLMQDGTYMLIGDAKELREHEEKAQSEKFDELKQQNQNEIDRLTTISNLSDAEKAKLLSPASSYTTQEMMDTAVGYMRHYGASQDDIANYYNTTQQNNQKNETVGQQLALANLFKDQLAEKGIDATTISNWQEAYDNGTMTATMLTDLAAAMQKLGLNSELVTGALEEQTKQQKELEIATQIAGKTADEVSTIYGNTKNEQGGAEAEAATHAAALNDAAKAGYDMEEFVAYSKTVRAEAQKNAAEGEEISESMAERLAYDNMQISEGLEDLKSGWKEWGDAIKNKDKDLLKYSKAIQNLNKFMKKLTGTTDDFSDEFLTSTENMELFEKAAKGDKEAIESLQKAAGKEKLKVVDDEALKSAEGRVANLAKKIGEGFENIDPSGALQKVQEAVDAADLSEIKIGTSLDAAGLSSVREGLQALADSGAMTADQISTYLESIGFEPDISYEEVTVDSSTVTQADGFTTFTDVNGATHTVTNDAFADISGDQKIKVPIINGKKKGGGGGGSSGGGGGGGKKKHIEKKQPEEAKDRYHVVKNQLEEQESQYKRIDTAYQRAFGKSKLDLLDKQIAKQKELIKTQKQYLDEAKEYLKYDKQQLELDARKQVYNEETNEYTTVDTSVAGLGMSIEWNDTGGIDNIDAIMKANLDRYNAEIDRINEALDSGKMTQEEADWAQKLAEAQYQGLLDTIGQYEETQDFVNEKLQDYIDAQNQYYDQLLEKTKLRVQLRVDIDEDSLNLINFLLERLEADAYKAAQRIDKLGESFAASADKMDAYKWGLIDLLVNHGDENAEGTFAKLMAGEITPEQLLQQMQEGGNIFTQAEADAIREYMQNIMSEATEQLEIQKKVIEEIGTVLEENNRRLDRQIGKIEHLQNVMSSYKNIIDLSGRQFLGITSEIYDAMEEANVKLANDTLEADKARMDSANAWLQKIKKDYAAVYDTLTDEAKKAYEEQIEAAEDAAQEATEAYYSSWEAAIEAINTRFESAMQHMVEDFSKTMAGVAGNLEGVQQRMDLRKMVADVYVPEYEKMYQLTKLTREAQKSIDNASNVKVKQELLRVQQKIVEAQESGAKISQYELDYLQRELDLKAAQMALEEASKAKSQVRMTRDSEGNYAYVYTANEEAVEEAEQNYADKLYEMQKLNEEYVASLQDMLVELESNYIQALQDAAETYGKGTEEYASAVADIQSQYGTYFDELMSEMGLVLSNNKETETIHAEIYKRLTGDVYQANVDLQTSWEETTLAGVTGYETLGQYQTAWAAASQKAYDDVIQANDIWMASMAEAYNLAGESIDTFAQTVGGDFEQIKEESQSLKKQIVEEDLPAMTEAINKVSESVKSWQKTYAEAIKAMLKDTENMIAKYNELLAKWSEVDRKHQAAEQQGNANDANSSTGTQTNGNNSNNNNGNTKSSSGGGKGGSSGSTGNEGGYGGGSGSSGLIGGNNAIRNLTMLRFATGGYTGDWAGDEGKVAVLDRKELVLNAQDTFNILKAVDMIKSISQTIDINAMSAGGAFSNLISPFVSGTGDRLEQEVHITAEFPNVTNKNEILEAFDNVINLASQYANR